MSAKVKTFRGFRRNFTEVGSLSHYLQAPSNWWLGMGFLNHQEYLKHYLGNLWNKYLYNLNVLAILDWIPLLNYAFWVDQPAGQVAMNCPSFIHSRWLGMGWRSPVPLVLVYHGPDNKSPPNLGVAIAIDPFTKRCTSKWALSLFPSKERITYPTNGERENHRLKHTLGWDMLDPWRLKNGLL